MDIRDNIIETVRKVFVGPDPIEGYCQANGEEIIRNINPKTKYSAGILHSNNERFQNIVVSDEEIDDPILIAEIMEAKQLSENLIEEKLKNSSEVNVDIEEEIVTLANEKLQSTFSFTCVLSEDVSQLKVTASFGIYEIRKTMNASKGKEEVAYYREGHEITKMFSKGMLPLKNNEIKYYSIFEDKLGRKLLIAFTKRKSPVLEKGSMFTFSLINATSGNIKNALPEFYQCKLTVESDGDFLPLPESKKITSDEEYLSNMLLYRHVSSYAIGHGCAVVWDRDSSFVKRILTESIPEYEMKYIVPTNLEGVEMSMDYFRKAQKKDTIEALKNFADEYSIWIRSLKHEQKSLAKNYRQVADKHIANCESCLMRMISGVEAISDEKIYQAFRLANEAMLSQQLHYWIPTKKWIKEEGHWVLADNEILPELDDKRTWNGNPSRYGKWRPFQLAFILMNIESMTKEDSIEREIIDLIWFPTGGGKTEAYLGLSAFTILYNRLVDQNHSGTDVLMRYTLRLLTTQQYERASSLICALEKIRANNPSQLGDNRITIGLWVGQSLSDNTTEKALKNLESLKKNNTDDNRFLVLKCPWCGAEMGVVNDNKSHKVFGYMKAFKSKEFQFVCGNSKCDYSKLENPLPLEIIDEQIYQNPPSIIIGTVDKFAVLPFNPSAKAIFGISPNNDLLKPPSLIIQDELHLISGPLGSMVGFYEFLIKELSGREKNNKMRYPKIIASTATISNAKQQCKDLYGVPKSNVFQFPPQGLDYRDSFFAKEDRENIGRKYVGINIPDSSTAMTDIKLYAALLYAGRNLKVLSEEYADAYWTILAYFNSLKDLGQTKTWVYSSIAENLASLYVSRKDYEKQDFKETRRYINNVEELTSRVRNSDISRILQTLSTRYNPENKYEAVDICLASNMISVGIDIPRLALMTVSGQPKTTAEYIQATSRVGRGEYPGLVFSHYYKSRPRDISHYEQFQSYHSKIYTYVEPTSVTPYSPQVRERALHAILIALYRIKTGEEDPSIIPDSEFMDYFTSRLSDRIRLIDENEWIDSEAEIRSLIEDWKIIHPQIFSTYTTSDQIPLIFSNNIVPSEMWGDRSWKTQSSLRTVDLMCKPKLIGGGKKNE